MKKHANGTINEGSALGDCSRSSACTGLVQTRIGSDEWAGNDCDEAATACDLLTP
jgi:hypothetical protein